MKSKEILSLSPGDVNTKTADILAHLFEEKDIINIQFSSMESGTLSKRGQLATLLMTKDVTLDKYKFLNPATFKKVEGVPNTKNKGKITTRCNDNVKARRYMVLEMDDKDEAKVERFTQFAMTMATFAPLVMALDTGNKSLHFWFDTEGATATQRKLFWQHACLHGADPRLAVKSQIARMPNVSAEREGRGPQKVLYYDPKGANYPEELWNAKAFQEFLNQARQLDYYYYGEKGGERYITRDDEGRFFSMNRTSTLVDLAKKGFPRTAADGEACSPAEDTLNTIQRTRSLTAVVSACAGRHSGYYEENGQRFVVTSSPKFIKPRKGQWLTIKKFLKGFMRDEEQYEHHNSLLAALVKDVYNDGNRVAGFAQIQMPHYCGPANSGKSLHKDFLLTPLMGGRQSNLDPHFKANPDTHNSEIVGAEVGFLDDTAVLSTAYQARQEHTERIKSMVVGGGLDLRAMFADRLNVKCLVRPFRFMNEEAQTLATLPLLDDGAEDKWVLYWTQRLNDHWPECEQPGWFEMVVHKFEQERPAFLHYLLYEHEPLAVDKCPLGRYPVRSYKNPDILNLLAEGSVENYLLYRLDSDCKHVLFGDAFDDGADLTPWRGSSDTLYDLIAATGSAAVQRRFQKVVPNPKVMASLLRQLEKDTNRVVYSTRCDTIPNQIDKKRYWQITPPEAPEVEPTTEFEGFDDLM